MQDVKVSRDGCDLQSIVTDDLAVSHVCWS